MAKRLGPSKQEELRWQAEDIVRQALKETPAFKKAVRKTMAELRAVKKAAVKGVTKPTKRR